MNTTKHSKGVFEIFDFDGNSVCVIPIFLNFHRTKGQWISERALSYISRTMSVPKTELIDVIRRERNFSNEELYEKYLIGKEKNNLNISSSIEEEIFKLQ